MLSLEFTRLPPKPPLKLLESSLSSSNLESSLALSTLSIWQYGLCNFHERATKLEIFLTTYSNFFWYLVNRSNSELPKSAKMWHSKSIFYILNDLNIFVFFTLITLACFCLFLTNYLSSKYPFVSVFTTWISIFLTN